MEPESVEDFSVSRVMEIGIWIGFGICHMKMRPVVFQREQEVIFEWRIEVTQDEKVLTGYGCE